jgi:hypothetical protein
MSASDPLIRTLVNALALLFIIYLIAVPFYMHFEGMHLVEAIYFVSVTITTVGYGDVTPKTDLGRMFTVLLLFSGVSIFFYHVTHIGQLKERAIDPHVQKRLQILRNLTALQTGDVKKEQIKKIKERIQQEREEKSQGFGKI